MKIIDDDPRCVHCPGNTIDDSANTIYDTRTELLYVAHAFDCPTLTEADLNLSMHNLDCNLDYPPKVAWSVRPVPEDTRV